MFLTNRPSVMNFHKDASMTSYLLSLCVASIGIDQAPPVMPPPRPVETPAVASCPLPISLCDFCRSFKPGPGQYEVLFIHPVKCCPVWVCFTLPPGCGTPKVCCDKRNLVFDYGCNGAVVVHFKLLCGGVKVKYY